MTYEEVDVTEIDDLNLEDEGLDNDVEDDVDVEEPLDTEDVSEEDDLEDDEDVETQEENDETNKESTKKFSEEQQEEIDRLIQTRLDRQETKLVKDLTLASGITMTVEDIKSASRLWGLLALNGNLSRAVDTVISEHLSTGKAVAPDVAQAEASSKESALALKEAVLDLKLSDPVFNKNSKKILAWAENEGLEVTDAKTLRLAYLGWKGLHGRVAEATRKTQEARKQKARTAVKKKAVMQPAKSGSVKSKGVDYGKMADVDLLVSEGLSLFTDD